MLAIASAFMARLIVGAVAVVGVLILIAVFISDAAQSCEDIGEEGAEGEIVGARRSDRAFALRVEPENGLAASRINRSRKVSSSHAAATNPERQG